MNQEETVYQLRKKIEKAWIAVELFLHNKDAHGIMDMGAEIQSLERAKKEVEQLER